MARKFVSVAHRDGVCTLSMNRPPRNLLSLEMLEEMNEAVLELRQVRRLKVLVLRGVGAKFCDGIDLEDHTPDKVARMLYLFHRLFETMRMLNLVAIAAVDGPAMGGGFEVALGCNLIVATDSASFGLPEIRYGMFAPTACIVLPRVAPRRKAMEWILLGEPISATELQHYGVVNRVWPDTRFDAELEAFLGKITRHSGAVLELAKRAQAEAYYATYEEALYKVENLYLRELLALKDPHEGVRAFLENRAPRWEDA